MKISETIRRAVIDRYESGVPISRIAQEAGVSQPTLSKWVRGVQETISLSTADALAEYLGLALVPADDPESQHGTD